MSTNLGKTTTVQLRVLHCDISEFGGKLQLCNCGGRTMCSVNIPIIILDLRIRVTDKARTVVASMLELVELLHEAEMTIDTSDDSAKLMDTTRALLGICPTYDAQPQAPPPAAWPSSTYIDDDFYSNPNFFKAVEEIERVVHERNALSNVPSFSLGLSQDVGMSQVEHMITIGTVAPRERAHAGGIEQARAKRSAGVVPLTRSPTNYIGHLTRRAPMKVLKPPRGEHHPPTLVARNMSHNVRQLRGCPTWIVPTEIYVYRWIFDNPGEQIRDDEIFRYNDHCALRGVIATLKDGSKVDFAVVDVWASVLNYRELTKANDLLSTFLDDKYETELASEIREVIPKMMQMP
nr:uncharacterized protein LOC109178682 isoform X1 [Ipomoea batatas]